jgi:hypothetical protein
LRLHDILNMASGNQPHLGATFVPGGFDDYYMPAPAPELVSPSPQRYVKFAKWL